MAANTATPTRDNVISMVGAAPARRRAMNPESVGMLNDCRDIAVKRIVAVLASTFDKIEDELFDLAEKTTDRGSQDMYLDARAQARDKRGAIEASFKKQFLSFFDKKVTRTEAAAASPRIDYAKMELSLVDDHDLEENIALGDIARRLSDSCDGELGALSQRLGFLLSEPELNDVANPMSPDTVVRALKAACDQMTSGYQSKIMVMRLVEQHMAAEMLGVYRDINSHLVARHILPQIRPSYRKSQTSVTRKPGAGSSPETAENLRHPNAGSDKTATLAVPANPSADIFATLQQLMAGGSMFDDALSAGSAAPPAFGVTTGSFAPPPPPHQSPADAMRAIAEGVPSITSAGLVAALTRMQQQILTESTNLQALAALRDFVPGETPLAALNVLHEIKSRGTAQGGSPVDVMTIDIVAMLFDYVFEDRGIPDSVKGLLARLQIPALKVAILDKSFFSRKSHPARRLLDTLADASVGFAETVGRSDSLFRKIEEVVDRIHGEFDTDIQLFTSVLADFEQFLARREAANADFVEHSARAVHEQERREMARLIAIDEVERRSADTSLPLPVTTMLKGPWARVLERTYLRENGRKAGFVTALETADDLVWSVLPKSNSGERKRLVCLLPALLKNLQEGMKVAAVESGDRARFFAALVDCHAAAVKAGLRGESVTALLAATPPSTDMGPLFAKLIAEEQARDEALRRAARSGIARIMFTDHGVEIEEITSRSRAGSDTLVERGVASEHAPASKPAGAGDSAGVDFDITEMPVAELKRGAWVEFLQAGGKKIRAKLAWISPLKGVYLFTNPGASEALSIAPGTLQEKMRRGEARCIEESSLVDRAVDHMVHALQEAAHA